MNHCWQNNNLSGLTFSLRANYVCFMWHYLLPQLASLFRLLESHQWWCAIKVNYLLTCQEIRAIQCLLSSSSTLPSCSHRVSHSLFSFWLVREPSHRKWFLCGLKKAFQSWKEAVWLYVWFVSTQPLSTTKRILMQGLCKRAKTQTWWGKQSRESMGYQVQARRGLYSL